MDNRANYIATSDEVSEADSETGWDLAMGRLIAESIRIADEINPNSWSLYNWKDRPVFGAGFVTLATMGPAPTFTLVVDNTEIDHESKEIHDRFRTDWEVPSRPWLSRLKIPQKDVQEALRVLRSAYMSALRRSASDTQTRCHRWKQHNERFRLELERALDENLPVPGYIADLAGTTAASANSAFYRDAGWDLDSLAELGTSILTAHETNPRSWAVRFYQGEIILYVAMSKVMALSLSFGHFMVEGNPPQYVREDLGSGTTSPAKAFDFETSWIGALDDDYFLPTIRRLRPQHDAIVRAIAATVKNKPQRANQHRQDIVDFISSVLDSDLPSPDYEVGVIGANRMYEGAIKESKRRVIQANFDNRGLTYTAEQIATFYTALQTKGFVVLSGISGTGKSKIAQHFVEMLPSPTLETEPAPPPPGSLVFSLSDTQTWAAIDATQSAFFPPIDNDVRHEVDFIFKDQKSSGHVILRVLSGGKPTLYLALGRDLTDRLRTQSANGRVYALPQLTENGSSLSTVRFSTEDRANRPTKRVPNSLFLAVRPDWRDSTSLLGYYNPLTQTYEWTEFLRFLLRAKESFRQKDGLAWFVILDEMNLAHVEYYFADLLSIIESGRDEEGWSREAIRLTYPDTLTDNAPPHEIKLPPNLYIIGTVNMDETTHAFSPKVLDRAFTIELTEVSFADYPPVAATADAAAGTEMADEERQDLLRAFTRNGTFAQISKREIRQAVDDHVEIRDWLESLNTRLAKDQFHFGYRVFDEIAQFVYIADRNGMFPSDEPDLPADWLSAFDHAVYMKVLPKFNGSHARLHGPLTTLVDWSMNPEQPDWGWAVRHLSDTSDVKESLLRDAVLQRVATRAMRMLELLEANGFVSFG